MAELSKASEERIKLVSSTLSNIAVTAVAAGILGPIIAMSLTPSLDLNVYASLYVILIVSCFITGVCCAGAWFYLGGLDAPSD
jgi:hypothetical protein